MAYDFSKLKTNISETEGWLARELSGVRTGRATPMILDGIKADAYGTRTALRELANVSVEDSRTLRITPWDKGLLKAIEKGITLADLGIGVSTDDLGLRVSFPELTSERRTQLSKIAGDKTEQARVTLRGHRTDAIKEIDASSMSFTIPSTLEKISPKCSSFSAKLILSTSITNKGPSL